MPRILSLAVIVVGLVPLAGTFVSGQAAVPPIGRLVQSAAGYVTAYEKQFSAVVSEERYVQWLGRPGSMGATSRVLRSDFLVMNAGAFGWLGFRDVYETDGRPIRDHEQRLLKLVTEPAADSFAQAKRLAAESARFNLGNFYRTINMPTMALLFLRTEFTNRSTFTFDGMKTVDGQRLAVLKFEEHAFPRIVETVDSAPARGRFWIDPASGRVVQTELLIDSAGVNSTITAVYRAQPKIEPWVPISMDESYQVTDLTNRATPMSARMSVIEGHAKYSNFRTFNVDVNSIVKK